MTIRGHILSVKYIVYMYLGFGDIVTSQTKPGVASQSFYKNMKSDRGETIPSSINKW